MTKNLFLKSNLEFPILVNTQSFDTYGFLFYLSAFNPFSESFFRNAKWSGLGVFLANLGIKKETILLYFLSTLRDRALSEFFIDQGEGGGGAKMPFFSNSYLGYLKVIRGLKIFAEISLPYPFYLANFICRSFFYIKIPVNRLHLT